MYWFLSYIYTHYTTQQTEQNNFCSSMSLLSDHFFCLSGFFLLNLTVTEEAKL